MVAELERWEFGDTESFIDRVIEGSIDPASLFPSWQRLFGYIEAHRAGGLSIDRSLIGRVGTYSVKAARTATMELLSRADRPTALFTADGLMSAVAMDAITTLDLQIPTDLSLICFDDLDWMSFLKPGITAIAQPLTEMGEAAARLILARISGEGGGRTASSSEAHAGTARLGHGTSGQKGLKLRHIARQHDRRAIADGSEVAAGLGGCGCGLRQQNRRRLAGDQPVESARDEGVAGTKRIDQFSGGCWNLEQAFCSEKHRAFATACHQNPSGPTFTQFGCHGQCLVTRKIAAGDRCQEAKGGNRTAMIRIAASREVIGQQCMFRRRRNIGVQPA